MKLGNLRRSYEAYVDHCEKHGWEPVSFETFKKATEEHEADNCPKEKVP